MFVLRLLGYQNVRNYDGSMNEWANRDDTPLVLD
jgi:thiosulfate/3-mercaptopyruvate sulfurtransferase